MSEQEIWKKVLEVAESEISKTTFNTFLKDTNLKKFATMLLTSLLFMSFMLIG